MVGWWGCNLDTILDIAKIEQEELVAEFLVLEVLVILPVGGHDVMALRLRSRTRIGSQALCKRPSVLYECAKHKDMRAKAFSRLAR